MVIYHGSRAEFDVFDEKFIGTGEGTQLSAFWFINSFEGATYHAEMISKHIHVPWVYTCEIPDNLPLADVDAPLSEQPTVLQRLQNTLPVMMACSLPLQDRNWSEQLLNQLNEIRNNSEARHKYQDHNALIEFLFTRCGIIGAHNWQGDCSRTRYKGQCTVIFAKAASHIRIRHIQTTLSEPSYRQRKSSAPNNNR